MVVIIWLKYIYTNYKLYTDNYTAFTSYDICVGPHLDVSAEFGILAV